MKTNVKMKELKVIKENECTEEIESNESNESNEDNECNEENTILHQFFTTNYSVSTILKYYFPRANLLKISTNIVNNKNWESSKYYNEHKNNTKPVISILNELKSKANKHQVIGKKFHRMAELIYYKNFNIKSFLLTYKKKPHNSDIMVLENLYKSFQSFLISTNNVWEILYTEYQIEHNIEHNTIYGRVDAIFNYVDYPSKKNYFGLIQEYYHLIRKGIINNNIIENKYLVKDPTKKNIVLVDWKCTDKSIFTIHHNNSKPLSFLHYYMKNTNYNKHTIQLNIYKYILEQNYNFIVNEMFIYVIDPYTYKYKIIPIIFIKNNIIKYLLKDFLN